MRAQAGVLAAAIILAPLGANAADLVVRWEKRFYLQADEAVEEAIPVRRLGALRGGLEEDSLGLVHSGSAGMRWMRTRAAMTVCGIGGGVVRRPHGGRNGLEPR